MIAEEPFHAALNKMLGNRARETVYPCVQDLLENGLDKGRFAAGEFQDHLDGHGDAGHVVELAVFIDGEPVVGRAGGGVSCGLGGGEGWEAGFGRGVGGSGVARLKGGR